MSNKKFIFLALIVFVILFTIMNIRQNLMRKHIPLGSELPDFEIYDIKKGQKVSSSSLIGNVVFVNFWASWCRPCIAEMESINNIYNRMSQYSNFKMVTIIYKEDSTVSMKYMRDSNYSLPVFSDIGKRASDGFGVTGVPETYIINKAGKVANVTIGPARWDTAEKINFIESLLKE